jgi:hypothetical protein
MTDWYLIERAEHDGRAWIEEVSPNVSELRCSSRFSDADVEGYGDEMLAIADAIESRGSVRFKRCAVNATSEPVTFCSPRNSRVDGECSLAEADSLVVKIRAMCKAVGMIDAASAH